MRSQNLIQQHLAEPLYFSCILPIAEIGYRGYLQDCLTGDRDFRIEGIAKPNEKANSILLFSFARNPNLAHKTGMENHELPPIYFRALAYHLDKVHQVNFNGKDTSVYFQNNGHSFKWLARLAGFEMSQRRSNRLLRNTHLFSLTRSYERVFGLISDF